MRRGIAATALVASLALAAAACGGDGDSGGESDGPVTVRSCAAAPSAG